MILKLLLNTKMIWIIFIKVLKDIMTMYDKTRDEKLQHDINRAAAEILALSSCKIVKYEYPAK